MQGRGKEAIGHMGLRLRCRPVKVATGHVKCMATAEGNAMHNAAGALPNPACISNLQVCALCVPSDPAGEFSCNRAWPDASPQALRQHTCRCPSLESTWLCTLSFLTPIRQAWGCEGDDRDHPGARERKLRALSNIDECAAEVWVCAAAATTIMQ